MSENTGVVQATDKQPVATIGLKEFLETVPVLERRRVQIVLKERQGSGRTLVLPSLQLYCSDAECLKISRFDADYAGPAVFFKDSLWIEDLFVQYSCRHCRRRRKLYALTISVKVDSSDVGTFAKVGEMPRFGEPRPDAVTDVLDDEIEFFDRGYRSEREGLGIGAFAYYRRFVESHKDKIIAEIRKVAVAQGLPHAILEALDRAAKKREFSAAVAEVKDAIPDSIKINGANPLTLLHDALSAGLHNEDDVDCLSIAQDIRLVLTGLAERTSQALKSSAEMAAAVNRLNQRRAGQKPT